MLNFNDNEFVSSIMSSFLNFGFYPTTKRATRLNSTNPINSSLIDHTWTNLDNLIDSNIILTDISDHFPCLSTFKNANPIKNLESITLKFRDLKKTQTYWDSLTGFQKLTLILFTARVLTLKLNLKCSLLSFGVASKNAFHWKQKIFRPKNLIILESLEKLGRQFHVGMIWNEMKWKFINRQRTLS